MIYFDNSATSGYKPECVVGAVSSMLRFVSANPGRAGHTLAARAASVIYSVRKKMAGFVGTDVERVVFCLSCTDALNNAILGTVREGGHVVTTCLEHNSVLRPLHELARHGKISLTVLKPCALGFVSTEEVERAIRKNTYLIAINHVSNVTGAVSPIAEIGQVAQRHGILFLVDGAQSVGYYEVDMRAQNIDLLAIAPHKGLHAPQGVGVLAMSSRVCPRPIRFGGTGTDSLSLFQPLELPESLEAGTLPSPAIAGLGAALSWTKKHFEQNKARLAELSDYLFAGLKTVPDITIYTPENTKNGIFSFNLADYSSAELSNILSEEYGICTRSGLHCAPLVHKYYGTQDVGMVRASLSAENTKQEVEELVEAMVRIEMRGGA